METAIRGKINCPNADVLFLSLLQLRVPVITLNKSQWHIRIQIAIAGYHGKRTM